MSSDLPLVSAVICVRDGERYLGNAIDSVLAQTHPRHEIVVIDNGSTDGSAALAGGYGDRVRIHSEPRAGIPFARNAGLAHASGDFIAFLDSDDTWTPDKTERQLSALGDDRDAAIALGHVLQRTSPGLDPEVTAGLRIPEEPQPGRHIGVALARREVFEEIGPWPTDMELSDGLHWFLRAGSLGLRQLMLPDILMIRHIHDANHSRLNRGLRPEFARVLKNSIDARRRGGAPPSS